MLQQIETVGLPRFETRDARVCREYIFDATGTHDFGLSQASQFVDFIHHKCTIGRTLVHFTRLESTHGFQITKATPSDYYSFQIVLEGNCLLNGPFGRVQVGPGDLFVLDPEHVIREYWTQNTYQIILHVDRGMVDDHAANQLHRKLGGHVVFDPVGRDPGLVPWLHHIAKTMWSEDTDTSLMADRRVAQDVERVLLTMLLTGLRHSESGDLERGNHGLAPYYVKRAEAYIHEHSHDDLTIDEIAEAAGVSPRTLFYGFKRWRSTSPMAYSRDVRLDRAREELEKARLDGGTVSQAAMNAGFTNFSQFSRIYKSRFGETPSTTLLKG